MSHEIFGEEYSSWYDILNDGKDYSSEVQLVLEKMDLWYRAENHTHSLEIIDFGCGSGLHDIEFKRAGHVVTGIDSSAAMLARARQSGVDQLIYADVRDLQTLGQFDLAVSLFHVMSYMIADEDVDALFANAFNNLKPKGIFIFDCWNSSVVLSSPQATRFKQIDLPGKSLYRISNSTFCNRLSRVSVNFDVFCQELADGSTKHFQEIHDLRHFSLNEIKRIARNHGFSFCEDFDWNSGGPASNDTFSRTIVLKKD